MANLRLMIRLILLFAASATRLPALPFSLENGVSHNVTSLDSLHKRELINECTGAFSDLLSQSINDVNTILKNMVKNLDLAIALYKDDGSGELKDDKNHKSKQKFDERNAFVSYNMIVSKSYYGAGDPRNQAGLERLKGTRAIASTIQTQYQKYVDGVAVYWTKGGFPYLRMWCSDEDIYSETSLTGKTYTEGMCESGVSYGSAFANIWFLDTGNPNPVVVNGVSRWYVSQKKGTEPIGELNTRYAWIQRTAVCDNGGGETTRFGGIPVESGIKAYVYPALFGLIEETMVFCGAHQGAWIATEAERTASNLHYRKLHVEIGSEPSDEQVALTKTLLAGGLTLRWLGAFAVQTVLHESSHAIAFVGEGNALVDNKCTSNGRPDGTLINNHLNPGCLFAIAKGTQGMDANGNPQGHKDAEAFAMYAMAMYVNTVTWKVAKPQERDSLFN